MFLMAAFTRHRQLRAMTSSTVYHVFLISWIHCIIVVFCSVAMATQSTDGSTGNCNFNISAGNASDNVKTLDTFFTILSVPCPPVDSLHFVCNHKIGDPRSTCEERASIINKCLHQFPGLYNNSQWSLCLMDVCKCEAVLNVLRNNDFINKSDDDAESVTVTTITVSTTLSTSNLTTSSITSAVSSQSTSITTSITTSSDTTSGSSESVSPMDDGSETPSSADGELNTVSYIYPIIGAFLIAFEIVMLCVFSCYKKKREHNANAGSLVLQEEVIEPVTSSPTKAALHPNSVYDEDSVLSEDKTIYKSYINLKYIDDTSAESTPEKALMRT